MAKSLICTTEVGLALLKAGGRSVPGRSRECVRSLSSHAPGIPQPATTSWRHWRKAAVIAGMVACPVGAAAVIKSMNREERKVAITPPTGPRRITDFYTFQSSSTLGRGQFGTVSTAVDKATGEVVAVKRVPRCNATEAHFLEEIDTHQEAGAHPNVIGLKGVFSDDDYWYIVMEVARGGELYDRLTSEGVMQKWEIQSFLRQLAGAVEHIHKRGIVHCDIKPENVLLRDPQPALMRETLDVEAAAAAAAALENARAGGRPDVGDGTPLFSEKESAPPDGMANKLMLADFGSSFRMDRGVTGENIDEQRPVKEYTAAYSAPEVVLDGMGDKKADIWSLGVIAYVMVKGHHPFDPTSDADEDDIVENVLHVDPDWDGIDPPAAHLIQRMLSKDPKHRPTARQILDSEWLSADVREGRC